MGTIRYTSSIDKATPPNYAIAADRPNIDEMQSKNYPGISMANKLGYEFCGYSDRYYTNQDIALFFAKRIQA